MRSAAIPTLVWALVAVWLLACGSVEERRRLTLERAERALALGDTPRALQVLEGFLSYDPRDQEIVTRMAEIHLGSGSPRAAIHILESLPGDVDLDARSTALLARALVASKQIKRAVLLLAGQDARGKADPEVIEDLLQRVARHGKPTHVELPASWYQRLAELQLKHERFHAAAESLRRVDDTSRRDELFEHLIHEALDAGELALLEELPELEQPPLSPWKLLARHRLLRARGLADDAAAVEQDFLTRYPEHPRRYDVLLSLARREIRAGNAERGLELARGAASLRPTEEDPLVEQAFAFEALGRAEEAERMLEIVLSESPHHAGALQLLSRMDRRRMIEDRPAQGGTGKTRVRLSIDSEVDP